MNDSVTTNVDRIGEQLSALLDGELSRDELRFLLRRIEADRTLAARWSRYQLAHAVLKRESYLLPQNSRFSAAVIARIENEQAAARPAFGALRWVGGGAIAAAVAVVALVVSRPGGDGALPAPTVVSVAAQPAAVQAQASDGTVRQAWLQQMLAPASFDYAQPASFETAPSYGYNPLLRYAAVGPNTYFTPDASMPYVLRAMQAPQVPPLPLPTAPASASPPQQ